MLPPPLLAFLAAPALLIALRLLALILLPCRPTEWPSAGLAAMLPTHGLVCDSALLESPLQTKTMEGIKQLAWQSCMHPYTDQMHRATRLLDLTLPCRQTEGKRLKRPGSHRPHTSTGTGSEDS